MTKTIIGLLFILASLYSECLENKKVPKHLHYNSNLRIGNLVVVADSSWSISRKRDKLPYGEAHDYDNKNMDMHGIFYAY